MTGVGRGHAALGLLLFAATAAAFPWLLRASDVEPMVVAGALARSTEAVDITGVSAPSDASLSVDGKPTAAAAEPGLHFLEWRRAFAGGYVERVVLGQLSGARQDPASPPCGVRVVVGPSLLGTSDTPGSAAAMVRSMLEREIDRDVAWPMGDFRSIEDLTLAFVAEPPTDLDRKTADFIGEPVLGGHLAVDVVLGFDRGTVRLHVALEPVIDGDSVRINSRVTANVRLSNRLYQWLANRLSADDRAASAVRSELGSVLTGVLITPPPLPLSGGNQLALTFCRGRQIEYKGGAVIVPMAVAIGTPTGDRADVLPVLRERSPAPAALPTEALAVELDLNALNGLLFELWRSGLVDDELVHGGHARRFNDLDIVRELLSVRIGDPRAALPPTLSLGPDDRIELRSVLTIEIDDRGQVTPADLASSLHFEFDAPAPGLLADITLGELAVTCRPAPDRAEACYSALQREMVEPARALAPELSRMFTDRLVALLVDRVIGRPEDSARFVIERARARTPSPGRVLLELGGAVRD